MGKHFIFVSGCPRSGTTVLAHILNWSDLVLIGQERYAALFNSTVEKFKPDLFSQARFFDFQKGDCSSKIFESGEYSAWYANKKSMEDFNCAELYGDKITNLYSNFGVFDNADWAQSSVKVIHSVRNIFDVAASYQTRLLNPQDGWSDDHIKAVDDWTQSVEMAHAALHAIERKINIYIVNYDSLFNGNLSEFLSATRKIYSTLGLNYSRKQEDGMKLLFAAGMHWISLRKTYPGLRESLNERISNSILQKYQELIEFSIC